VCLDTCHLFAAGYTLYRPKEYDEVIEEVQQRIGIDRIRVWHLNDSSRECGSRVDRHAGIGAGKMGKEPFRHLVNDLRFRHLPMILETPKGIDRGENLDRRNLKILKRLVTR
jgi:deoxyribonuclease-4